MAVEHLIDTGSIFFAQNLWCAYLNMHITQKCTGFSKTGFITQVWSMSYLVWGSFRCWVHSLMTLYIHFCHLLGTAAVCDDGFGPQSFNDRTAFCLFSLITVVWGCNFVSWCRITAQGGLIWILPPCLKSYFSFLRKKLYPKAILNWCIFTDINAKNNYMRLQTDLWFNFFTFFWCWY